MIELKYTDKIEGEYYKLFLDIINDREWLVLPSGYVYETLNAGEDIVTQIGAIYEVKFTKLTD